MSNPTRPNIEDVKQRWLRAVKSAEVDKPAIIARDKQLWEAIEERSLSGEFRRAVFESRLSTGEISAQANVPLAALNGFLHGESPLDSEALNRIAQVLDCHVISPT